eukprot:GEMP01059337.1.p1 GENE.GEMP01059337.1~~GEMP01059337.1.p1  ORF type:complete len:334 (+),score=95.74 GEMP01059337.1:56-1057(+)
MEADVVYVVQDDDRDWGRYLKMVKNTLRDISGNELGKSLGDACEASLTPGSGRHVITDHLLRSVDDLLHDLKADAEFDYKESLAGLQVWEKEHRELTQKRDSIVEQRSRLDSTILNADRRHQSRAAAAASRLAALTASEKAACDLFSVGPAFAAAQEARNRFEEARTTVLGAPFVQCISIQDNLAVSALQKKPECRSASDRELLSTISRKLRDRVRVLAYEAANADQELREAPQFQDALSSIQVAAKAWEVARNHCEEGYVDRDQFVELNEKSLEELKGVKKRCREKEEEIKKLKNDELVLKERLEYYAEVYSNFSALCKRAHEGQAAMELQD